MPVTEAAGDGGRDGETEGGKGALLPPLASGSVRGGRGSVQQAHTKDKFITVADLETGVEFFRQFLGRL